MISVRFLIVLVLATFSISSFAVEPHAMYNRDGTKYKLCCSVPPIDDGFYCPGSIINCATAIAPTPVLELNLFEAEHYKGDLININGVTYKRVDNPKHIKSSKSKN
jgi:hypothetical protein